MLDGNILCRAPGGHFSVNLRAKNITDQLDYAGSFSVSTSRAIGGTLMPPRRYGSTPGYAFSRQPQGGRRRLADDDGAAPLRDGASRAPRAPPSRPSGPSMHG